MSVALSETRRASACRDASSSPRPIGAAPRHVLMTTDAVGGVWRYSVDLARALNDAGVRVLLVSLGPAPSDDKVHELSSLPSTRLVALDQPLDWLAANADELAAVPSRLEALAASEGVDLLHLNAPSQASGLSARLPLVVVSHSCVVTWWRTMRGETPLPAPWAWQFALNRAGLRRADLVLAPTRSHALEMERAYGPFGPVGIVPNAVSDAREETDAPREPFVFAAARWWDEGKNAATLDRAAGGLAWPVRAAGACRGSNGEEYRFSQVEWLGELRHDDTRERMGRAAIFVSPSRYEPFGLAALEAAEAGAALVLADIATYRELWDGAALFADPGEAGAFRRAIGELIRDEALRRDLAAAARERAARFTPQRQIRALLDAYQTALGRCAMSEFRSQSLS